MTERAWLEEVIARATAGDAPEDVHATARRVLPTWRRAVGGGAALRRRLRWSEHRTARAWLTAPVAGDPSVDWAAGLRALVDALAAGPVAGAADLGEMLRPIGAAAEAAVAAALRTAGIDAGQLLAADACRELGRSAIRRVSKPLLPAWTAWRGEHPLTRLAGEEPALAALQTELAQAALRPVWERFPVAARLAGTVYQLEIAAQVELLTRLACDLDALRAEWSLARPQGAPAVRSLGLHLADPHRGGRSVAWIETHDGTRIVCKPHPLDLETAMEAWWREVEPQRPPVRYLAREGYGWMEWIEARPPDDAPAAVRLHRRLGALLARSLEFGLCDLQRGNVLFAGEHPIVVDAECLRPLVPIADTGAPALAEDPVRRLLGSGILPRWQRNRRDARLEPRALLGANLGEAETAAVVEGFLEAKPTVHPPERLRAMAGARARFLVRPTTAYSVVQRRLLRPDALEDIRVFDALADTLVHGWADTPQRPLAWPLIEAERRALYRLDVPAFEYVPAETHLLACDGTRVDGAFAVAPTMRWPARAPQTGSEERERNRQRHAALIRSALGAPRALPLSAAPGHDAAAEIARHLLATAIPAADGAPTWLGYDCDPADLVTHPALADDGVYNGRAGIALFLLVARERCAGAGEAAERVFDALADGQPAGGFMDWAHGRAGCAVALQAAGEFAERADWREAARRMAEEIAQQAGNFSGNTEDWARFDLFSGIAGAAIALSQQVETLDAACALAAHLERWLGRAPRRAGLMHGASGVAVGCGRVAAACARAGRSDEAAAAWRTAMRAVAWENGNADPAKGPVWPVQPGFEGSWCHHTAGIALARATLLRCAAHVGEAAATDEGGLRADLERATDHLSSVGPAGLDLLCCGRLGGIAGLLLSGARTVGDARVRLADWKARVAEAGWNLDATPREAWVPPGLCRGLAGAGWLLLAAEDERARALLGTIVGFAPAEAQNRGETTRGRRRACTRAEYC